MYIVLFATMYYSSVVLLLFIIIYIYILYHYYPYYYNYTGGSDPRRIPGRQALVLHPERLLPQEEGR